MPGHWRRSVAPTAWSSWPPRWPLAPRYRDGPGNQRGSGAVVYRLERAASRKRHRPELELEQKLLDDDDLVRSRRQR